METTVLQATRRDVTGKKVKALRRQGILPAVLYGHKLNPVAISLDLRDASKILASLTSSSLVKINLEGEELTAIVRDKQREYLKSYFLHVDFQIVSMTEKIRATVQVELVGTSSAVKEHNAVVDQIINAIDVECLPGDMPEKFILDISKLTEIGDQIFVKDIEVSSKVDILLDPEETIVSVTLATAETEPAEGEELETGGAEPEVIEKGKKEEDLDD